MQKQVYYAHSKRIYNTMQEDKERRYLQRKFKNVVCPNRDMGDYGSIEPYLVMVRSCTGVVCSEYNGHIGRGVYDEVNTALKHRKFVWCLRKVSGVYKIVEVTGVEIVDETDWAVCYGKVVLAKRGTGRKRRIIK